MRLKFLVYLVVIIIALTAFPVHAASLSSILVNVAPENPGPNEEVTITLNSYANNLDSVLISWSVDGKPSTSDIGKKSFIVTAPEAGKEMRISVTVALSDGNLEKIIVLRPVVMALLWQANDSYVPPFYKGKAMPSIGSEIKVVAMPEIKIQQKGSLGIVNPKNMVYAWKKDYTNDPGASGYGKNFYTFITDYLEDTNHISVTASVLEGNYSSVANLDVRTFQPKILFYRNDATLGTLWESALSDGHRVEGAEVIEAAPYFISPRDLRIPSFVWDWSINGSYVSVDNIRKNVLPLQTQPGVSGTSNIKLELSNKYNLLTSAQKEIRVEF